MSGDVREAFDVVHLYEIESNLVQTKIGHILTIRSLALPLLAGVVGSSLLYPGHGLEFLTLVLIPFYVVESIYDGYLISLVERETLLRGEIAKLVEGTGLDQKLVTVYRNGLDHRKTPQTWGPFKRAFFEPVRVGFYAAVILIPFLVLYFRQG